MNVSDAQAQTPRPGPARGTRTDPDEADRRLRLNATRMWTTGKRLLLGGVVLAVVGGALALLGSGTSELVAIGDILATVAAVSAVAAITLMLSAAVSAWAGRRRPFA